MNEKLNLGFIGCGKMASALIEGVLHSGAVTADRIRVSDQLAAATDAASKKWNVTAVRDNQELASASEVLILCVKPADAVAALRAMEVPGKLIVSIVAGMTLETLEQAAAGARIVRVMPNTPALVQKSASAYALGQTATEEDAAIVEKILGAVGICLRVKESMLDAVTGLSGSGPAYVYVMIEAMADAGVRVGLPRELALQLAAQTVAGSAEMVLQTGLHPAQLKDMVTSPGGTTIAGLEALENGGFRAALIAAVRTATERSRELAKGGG